MSESDVIERASRWARQAGVSESNSDLVEAIGCLDAALELRPAWPPYLVSKGNLLRQLQRYVEAETVIREAINVDPAASYAWTELGLLGLEREEFEKAAFCFEESLKYRVDYCTLTVLANAQLAFDPSLAVTNAQKALELRPDWEEASRILIKARQILKSE